MIFESVMRSADVATRIYMRARGWLAPVAIATLDLGFRMHCDIRDFIQRRIFFFRIYEHNLTHYLRHRLKPGDCFVDVGANVGYVTLVGASVVGPTGAVVSVEASPTTYERLVANIRLNGLENVTAINMAATDGPCTVEVTPTEDNNIGSATIRPAATGVKGDRLTSILGDRVEQVAAIKIDIEGSEPPVLEDILQALPRFSRLGAIVVEAAAPSAEAIAAFGRQGFRLYALPNDYTIAHYLIRNYLSARGAGDFVTKIPVRGYEDGHRDYLLERDLAPPNGAAESGAFAEPRFGALQGAE